MGVTIRKAAKTDVGTIIDLWWEMMDFHACVDARFRPLPRTEAVKAWEKHLRADILGQEGWRVLLAEDNGRVVGMMIGSLRDPYPVFEQEPYGFVADAVVAPGARRKGVARMLFEALKAWFREQGVSHIQLEVGHLNATSQAFWRAMGCTGYMDVMRVDLTE
jgi:ribosomal protein S18 acetylase RimI-like enzyme